MGNFEMNMIERLKNDIKNDIRLTNRMNDNNPRAAAKILARNYGNHSGAIKNARIAVNELLEERGLPPIKENWEGYAKVPSWYKLEVSAIEPTDNYIGGGINFYN